MKTVLVVDDDRVILKTLVAFLSSYAEDLELLTAENGRQAVAVLEREPVDLLLTDLYMPEMDGFELLAHMVRNFQSVPIIVMSGYEVPEMGDDLARKGALHYLEKPFDFPTLAETVRQTLARTSKGHLAGISLLGFLQLLNFEKKSCSLAVASGEKTGRIHVTEGELINAEHDRLQGESAVFEILSWNDCEIDISVPRRVERLIHRPLHGVILEAAKDQDESRAAARAVSDVATVPIALDDGALDRARAIELSKLLDRPLLQATGTIGLALVDVEDCEVLGFHCYQYWPDFNERATAAAPAVRRRLELDDGEQVEDLQINLEALAEIWRPVGGDRRMVFYLLMNRELANLDVAREELARLAPWVRELLEIPAGTQPELLS